MSHSLYKARLKRFEFYGCRPHPKKRPYLAKSIDCKFAVQTLCTSQSAYDSYHTDLSHLACSTGKLKVFDTFSARESSCKHGFTVSFTSSLSVFVIFSESSKWAFFGSPHGLSASAQYHLEILFLSHLLSWSPPAHPASLAGLGSGLFHRRCGCLFRLNSVARGTGRGGGCPCRLCQGTVTGSVYFLVISVLSFGQSKVARNFGSRASC